eukprot:TRINITY_DN5560_c0_g1_i3.p1 TRINITY_DN5560_c0_g1~~TRINITY_DN5560_c0_g1_i3.p1  ORF type:complete len:301 (+),score=62.00 TRINITY_DN5560_c0_g1_i3:941-1843(+)
MLSGIGPEKHLQSHGIEVLMNLPGVGQNLQDHLFTPGLVFACKQPVTKMREATPFRMLKNMTEYFFFRSGSMTTTGVEGFVFVRTGVREDLGPIPDLQIIFVAGLAAGDENARRNLEIDFPRHALTGHGVTIMLTLLQPKSKGFLELRNKYPSSKPIIDPKYLTDIDDVRTLREGWKIARRIMKTQACEPYFGENSEIYDTDVSQHHAVDSDAYIDTMIRKHAATVYHPVGTCKMGKDSDPLAVLDSRLRVRGISGLRVADCASMPVIPAGNTNAPAIMVGEKAAAMIAEDNRFFAPSKL